MRRLIPLLGIVVCAATASGALASRPSARDEANLVVSRFLVAAALGDRHTACGLYPSYGPCLHGERFFGPTHFRVVAITALPDRTVVRVTIGRARGAFVLDQAGDSFAIVSAPKAFRTLRKSPVTADLVVTRFLVASALGDRRTACALYPSDFPCSHEGPVGGSANFAIVGTSLADPARPAVFARVDGLRGYFVLEHSHGSFRIVTAGLD
jgi:hypothetical protein